MRILALCVFLCCLILARGDETGPAQAAAQNDLLDALPWVAGPDITESAAADTASEAASHASEALVASKSTEGKLNPNEVEYILNLGYAADSQQHYGGRHITIATFVGSLTGSATAGVPEFTISRLNDWIRAKCLDTSSLKSGWTLNQNDACVGHLNLTLGKCKDNKPWNISTYGNTYTIVFPSRALVTLGECLKDLQQDLLKSSTGTALTKKYGVISMSVKGPKGTNSTGKPKSTEWHCALYQNPRTRQTLAQAQADQKRFTGKWLMFYNARRWTSTRGTPCPNPASPSAPAINPLGNPGDYDKATKDYGRPFCWAWTKVFG